MASYTIEPYEYDELTRLKRPVVITPELIEQLIAQKDMINNLITSHAELEQKYRDLQKKVHNLVNVNITC